MSDFNSSMDKPEDKKTLAQSMQKNKKMILWAIVIVVVLVVLYVLFGNNLTKYRLCTDARNNLENANAAASGVVPAGTGSETSIGLPSASVSLNNASAVRRELANLFKSYA